MKYNPIFRKFVAYLFIVGMLASCNQYKAIPTVDATAPTVKNLMIDEDGIINSDNILIHAGGLTYHLTETSTEKNQLIGILTLFDDQEADNYTSSLNDKSLVNEKGEKMYSHFFDPSNSLSEGDLIMISVDDKTGNVLLKQQTGEIWKVIVGVLLVMAALIGGMFIFLLIACNCPHAYVFDGKNFRYTNTLFTGATAPNLERNDFKLMEDFTPTAETFEMILKNEENESHFFNLLELIVVGHEERVEIATDQKGTIHTLSNLVNASKVVNEAGQSLEEPLSFRDEIAYSFDSYSSESMVNAYASFERPKDVSNAKLVLTLKNSEWGGMVYKTFATMMGDKYAGWVEKNRERSTAEAIAALKEAGIPLIVSVKVGEKWIDLEAVDLVGEVAYNTLAFSIDQKYWSGNEITFKLQGGFKFWELDYVGMDFSADQDIEIQVLNPTLSTIDLDKTAALQLDDTLYMQHDQTGDSTYFKFEGLPTSKPNRTLILHSKGYYLSNEHYSGDPYLGRLMKLRAPGGLSRLSRELYEAYESLVYAASNQP